MAFALPAMDKDTDKACVNGALAVPCPYKCIWKCRWIAMGMILWDFVSGGREGRPYRLICGQHGGQKYFVATFSKGVGVSTYRPNA